eukprot:CAMPEP_0172497724 /NCGR_PEP_ID=MMETSP1066-20121228/104145_1 /TAXON_ID=671091 /ORGANISM="Coscinodiscus wailesii, Strain CCMP2513" /LENGTH=410 /DNA_ID=CAMNT_0013270655 /DNA_START=207 /DNA_END=1439 /DNA_ORIENTATION=-
MTKSSPGHAKLSAPPPIIKTLPSKFGEIFHDVCESIQDGQDFVQELYLISDSPSYDDMSSDQNESNMVAPLIQVVQDTQQRKAPKDLYFDLFWTPNDPNYYILWAVVMITVYILFYILPWRKLIACVTRRSTSRANNIKIEDDDDSAIKIKIEDDDDTQFRIHIPELNSEKENSAYDGMSLVNDQDSDKQESDTTPRSVIDLPYNGQNEETEETALLLLISQQINGAISGDQHSVQAGENSPSDAATSVSEQCSSHSPPIMQNLSATPVARDSNDHYASAVTNIAVTPGGVAQSSSCVPSVTTDVGKTPAATYDADSVPSITPGNKTPGASVAANEVGKSKKRRRGNDYQSASAHVPVTIHKAGESKKRTREVDHHDDNATSPRKASKRSHDISETEDLSKRLSFKYDGY